MLLRAAVPRVAALLGDVGAMHNKDARSAFSQAATWP